MPGDPHCTLFCARMILKREWGKNAINKIIIITDIMETRKETIRCFEYFSRTPVTGKFFINECPKGIKRTKFGEALWTIGQPL